MRIVLSAAAVALVACTAHAPKDAPASSAASAATAGLEGTSWRLVEIAMGDGATRSPAERSHYTLGFGRDGVLNVRFDCNRGRGTWKSEGHDHLEFGPLALTRALCPVGSLHDDLVRQWPHVRSYLVEDGRLFLSLMADGGILEFEPAP